MHLMHICYNRDMFVLFVDKLRVGPEQLATDSIELLKALVSPQYLDLAIETLNDTNSKIIDPILASSDNEIVSTFQKNLVPFTLKIASLNTLILLSQQNNLLRLASLDQTFYAEIIEVVRQSSSPLGVNTSTKIIDAIERLADYENVLLGILINRLEQLVEALKEVDGEDLLRSMYGTVLALACILVLLRESKLDSKKIEILLRLAEEHSEIMESYADTIDIMSNKEEMELLKRSEQN